MNRKFFAAPIAATLGLLAGVCACGSQAKASEPPPPSRVVRFHDLDITTPIGARILYRRIQIAAQQVCEPPNGTYRLALPLYHACVNQAIDEAIRTLNAPLLTELHAGTAIHLAGR